LLSSYRAKQLEQRLQAEREEAAEANSIYSKAEAANDAPASAGVLRKAYRWMTGVASVGVLAALVWGVGAWYGQGRVQAATAVASVHTTRDATRAIQQGFSGDTDDGLGATEQASAPAQPASLEMADAATQWLVKRLVALNQQERNALGLACLQQAETGNADKFAVCLEQQLAHVTQRKHRATDLLNADEQSALEYACMGQKLNQGLPAYSACVDRQMADFSVALRPASWDNIEPARQKSIQEACAEEKYGNGPAAYDKCLSRHAEL
jgi:hypothetical protein